MSPESTIGLLVLMAGIAAGSFYAGWRSAHAFLEAAKAVSYVTNSAEKRSNNTVSALAEVVAESASLREAVNRNTEVMNVKQGDVEKALLALFQGFERTGVVRGPRTSPGRQVGETSPE